VPAINENGLTNLTIDIDFLESEFKRLGKPHLISVFIELRETIALPVSDDIPAFLSGANRQTVYRNVQPRRVATLLDKMWKYGSIARTRAEQDRAERRGAEARAVARLN